MPPPVCLWAHHFSGKTWAQAQSLHTLLLTFVVSLFHPSFFRAFRTPVLYPASLDISLVLAPLHAILTYQDNLSLDLCTNNSVCERVSSVDPKLWRRNFSSGCRGRTNHYTLVRVVLAGFWVSEERPGFLGLSKPHCV